MAVGLRAQSVAESTGGRSRDVRVLRTVFLVRLLLGLLPMRRCWRQPNLFCADKGRSESAKLFLREEPFPSLFRIELNAFCRIPFRWDPPEKILESILACRLMRLPNVDRVIAFKFPAYFLPHDNKILWLVHQFRQAYDLWGTPYQGMASTPENAATTKPIRTSTGSMS